MAIHAPSDRKTCFEARARNANALGRPCADPVAHAALLQIAESWALLAHLQAADQQEPAIPS